MRILGISAYYHDSAAALVVDGEVVAAAQEERFSRRKHDERFPTHAVAFCLKEAGATADTLDHVVFYEKPLRRFDRLIETQLAHAPFGLRSFLRATPLWLKTKLHLPREIRRALGPAYVKPLIFTAHHESHAASAFYPSPFPEAAILTVDGVGEWATAAIAQGDGNSIRMLRTLDYPHSLGLLYSAFTYFTGFRVNSGEYKLMGLAPYGRPRYVDRILTTLLDLKADGSFALDQRYFNYSQGLTMTNRAFAELFDGPPRKPETAITQREMDLAASIQAVTEEVMLRMAAEAKRLTGRRHLCLAGGVALNCVANGRLRRAGLFDDIWVQPAPGDAGGALGAALFVHHQLLDGERQAGPGDRARASLLGPAYSAGEIAAFLEGEAIPYLRYARESELLSTTAAALAAGAVVGWFHGRMEFGPRALGARSLLGDPRNPAMQSTMNLRVKFRESFRPFAPAVLREDVANYFDFDGDSPYMLFVAPVRNELRLEPPADTDGTDCDLTRWVNTPRSTIPAVTHVDYSARIQTVDERHGRFYRLLREFKRQTGCSVLINTSFNVRGEPIVCSPADAYRCFAGSDIDLLVLEQFVINRAHLPPRPLQPSAGAMFPD